MVPPVATDTARHEAGITYKLSKVSFNTFYSNIPSQEDNDDYEYAQYKVYTSYFFQQLKCARSLHVFSSQYGRE